jgi:hypothetical protein|eukprot:scaffold2368_cov289-Chaetoceros_neogracile.AAC.26
MDEPTGLLTQSSLAMITSNQSYGLQLNELKKMHEMMEKKEGPEATEKEQDCDLVNETIDNNEKICNPDGNIEHHDLSFLYTRESDKIGEGVKLSNYPLAKQFRQKNQRRKPMACGQRITHVNGSIHQSKNQVRALLSNYNHSPKKESPLFTTTGNDIGLNKPNIGTFNSDKYARSQTFSKSFNSMFSDQGLKL